MILSRQTDIKKTLLAYIRMLHKESRDQYRQKTRDDHRNFLGDIVDPRGDKVAECLPCHEYRQTNKHGQTHDCEG